MRTVCLLEPTFGGVNLEDIKGPDCFYVEEECKKRMSIPVFHDDQHGTAIICLGRSGGQEVKVNCVFSWNYKCIKNEKDEHSRC